MIKVTKRRTYDTDTATVVKKCTCSYYGDPAGYELTMYITPEGDYFLYCNGGEESPYSTEKIRGYTKPNALLWLDLR